MRNSSSNIHKTKYYLSSLIEHKPDKEENNIWRYKSRSWVGTCMNMWRGQIENNQILGLVLFGLYVFIVPFSNIQLNCYYHIYWVLRKPRPLYRVGQRLQK